MEYTGQNKGSLLLDNAIKQTNLALGNREKNKKQNQNKNKQTQNSKKLKKVKMQNKAIPALAYKIKDLKKSFHYFNYGSKHILKFPCYLLKLLKQLLKNNSELSRRIILKY